jgi:phospholipase/carboxylesterase
MNDAVNRAMTDPIVVQAPASGQATHLFLLFHGVGATAEGLAPLGKVIGARFPDSAVLSVPGPFESDLGAGRQWFSVRAITEENRISRIGEVMPLFGQTVRDLQQRFGAVPEATTLVGFSQGAIMALESGRRGKALAGRIVSIAGRFAQLPDAAPKDTALHLIHGQEDAVIPSAQTVDAAQKLKALGAAVTADVVPGAGHGITQPMVQVLLQRLRVAA